MSEVTIRERWLGAVCYLSLLVFIPMLAGNKSSFLARHCRQGFALFFAEVVAWLLLRAVEGTLGRVPVIGFLLSIVLYLVIFLAFLIVSVLGFFKALSGQSWRIPFLDEVAEKVPIQATENPAVEPGAD